MSGGRRWLSVTRPLLHENPLGLPRAHGAPPPPTMPRRGGLPQKRGIPNVKKVLLVASGKGGVGKSTVAVNLAASLALNRGGVAGVRPRVGLLDLDVFGPSVPKLMGLASSKEPELTSTGALIPLRNHGLPCMSMGFLLPTPPDSDSNADTPIVWRGLMVQKAVQQLLFDVDWRESANGAGLDVLVIDMPPGTGDVPLTVGQLVNIDGAVIVSTPQDVALSDVRKGVAMFRKISVSITGLVLNQSYFLCPSCTTPHTLFGPPDVFRATAARLGIDVLGEFPLAPGISTGGDQGIPYPLLDAQRRVTDGEGGERWLAEMDGVTRHVWGRLGCL